MDLIDRSNIAAGDSQRVDIEIVDGSNHRNIYQNKKNIGGETRMAITTHADADLGVCFQSHLDRSECLSNSDEGALLRCGLRRV